MWCWGLPEFEITHFSETWNQTCDFLWAFNSLPRSSSKLSSWSLDAVVMNGSVGRFWVSYYPVEALWCCGTSSAVLAIVLLQAWRQCRSSEPQSYLPYGTAGQGSSLVEGSFLSWHPPSGFHCLPHLSEHSSKYGVRVSISLQKKDRPRRTSRARSSFGAPAWFGRTGPLLGLFFSCTRSVAYTVAVMRCVVVSQNSLHLHGADAGHHGLLITPGLHASRTPGAARVHSGSWRFCVVAGEGWFWGLSWSSQRKVEFSTLLMQRYQSQLWELYMFYKRQEINNRDFVLWVGAKHSEDV